MQPNIRRTLTAAAAAVAVLSAAACNNNSEQKGAATPAEQSATPDANPAATLPTPANEAAAPDFVAKASASDLFEITAAKLAQTRSANAEVKKFAKEMVTAHTKSSADLKKAIATAKQTLTPAAALPSDLQGKIDDLKKADAKDFDKKYIDGQVDAHEDALNLLQRYAQDGDVADIKTFAASTAPIVQQHLDMAKKIQDALK